MKFHSDVLAAHAEFGGDLQSMQALYDRPDLLAKIEALEARCRELEEENERLTKRAWMLEKSGGYATDDVARLEAYAQKLTEALRPFAADYAGRSQPAPVPDIGQWPIGGSSLTYGHLRRASEALSLTPSSALAAVRDEVREECAKIAYDIIPDGEHADEVAATSRARKETGE